MNPIADAFEELLTFWLELKQQLKAHLETGKPFVARDGTEIANVKSHLQSQLNLKAITVRKQQEAGLGSSEFEVFDQVLYAFVALVDEQLLQEIQWSHNDVENAEAKREWLALLLERELFRSRNAGATLIDRMEALVEAENANQAGRTDLAPIYLTMLWLGFDGKYRQQPHKLETLKEKLAGLFNNQLPSLEAGSFDPQPYPYELKELLPLESARLAPRSAWNRKLMLGFALFLITGALLWFSLTWALGQALAVA